MIRQVLGAVSVVAMAASVAGADVVNIEWSVSNPVLTPADPSTTILMTATWSLDIGRHFARAEFDILGSNTSGGIAEGRWVSGGLIYLFDDMTEGWVEAREPDANNNLYNGYGFILPPFMHGRAPSPMHWWFTYTATDFTPRDAGYTSLFRSFEIYTDNFGSTRPVDPIVTPAAFRVVPAPAAGAAVIAPLVPLIRRRHHR